jgi:hypothetical protein
MRHGLLLTLNWLGQCCLSEWYSEFCSVLFCSASWAAPDGGPFAGYTAVQTLYTLIVLAFTRSAKTGSGMPEYTMILTAH